MLLFVRNEFLKFVRLMVLDMCIWVRLVNNGVLVFVVFDVLGIFFRFRVLDVSLISGIGCPGWFVSLVDLLNQDLIVSCFNVKMFMLLFLCRVILLRVFKLLEDRCNFVMFVG